MEFLASLVSGTFVLALVAFLLGGAALGWYSFFALRKLKDGLPEVRPAAAGPKVPPQVTPGAAALPPKPAPVPQPGPPPQPPEAPAGPAKKADWEKKFLENWTGILGLVVITAGLGFLGVYSIAILGPFWRFLALVTLGLACYLAGAALARRQDTWIRWGWWLQSLGAAVFLLACLGAGGIDGLAWVPDPLLALGLLLVGIAFNYYLAARRQRQPYLTFHAVLSLVVLAVPGPNLWILAFLSATAAVGLIFSWFQRWPYNRAVTALLFQGILVLAHFRMAAPDFLTQVLFLSASGAVALLVHGASYRRLEQGTPWSRPAFITHLANAGGASLAWALWAPHSPAMTVVTIGALALGLFVLGSRAKATGTRWLYRTDRTLAVAAGSMILVLNPLEALPLVLAAGALMVLVGYSWVVRNEGDPWLTAWGDRLTFAAVGALALASVIFTGAIGVEPWIWDTAAMVACGLGVLGYLMALPEPSLRSNRWLDWTWAALPALFLVPALALLRDPAMVPGVPPTLVFLVPWVLMGAAARQRNLPTLAWSLVLFGLLAGLASWTTALSVQDLQTAPAGTFIPGGTGVFLVCLVPLVFSRSAKEPRFTVAFAGAFLAFGGLVTTTGVPWFPAFPLASALGLLTLALLLVRHKEKTGPWLSVVVFWAGTVLAAAWRLSLGVQQPADPAVLGCDLAAVALLVAMEFLGTQGPGFFGEAAILWALGLSWADFPEGTWPWLMAITALAVLVGSRFRTSAPRLEWYSAGLFLGSNGALFLTEWPWVKLAALGTLVLYLVVDSLVRRRADAGRYRRYALVLVQAATVALVLPTFLNLQFLTLGWSLEAFLVFLLAVVWKESLYKNTAFAALGLCLVRLIFVDLSGTDLLVRALTFLSVGGLMVGMNVLYLWSRGKGKEK